MSKDGIKGMRARVEAAKRGGRRESHDDLRKAAIDLSDTNDELELPEGVLSSRDCTPPPAPRPMVTSSSRRRA